MMQWLYFYCGNYRQIPPEKQAEISVISQSTESNECMTLIGSKLVKAAKLGPLPVYVFSNVDHVFNGMRIGVMQQDALAVAEKVRIIYTAADGEVFERRVAVDGRVVGDWPEGMFDQNLKNLAVLGRARRATAAK